MKKQKWWIGAVCLPVVAFAVMLCIPSNSMTKHLENRLGIALPAGVQVEYEDSHGGFHGDGTLTAQVTFPSQAAAQTFSDTLMGQWEQLPVSKPGLWDAAASAWEELHQVEQGFWFYRDRYYEQYGERCGFNPYLQNCTFAVMDTETSVLYVLETDF